MTEKDIVFMNEALRLAEAARDAGEIPVGAVVVKNIEESGTYVGVPAQKIK